MIDVLIVCEGNICRSPAAAALLSDRLTAHGGFQLSSAGTGAREGRAMDPPFAARLRAVGVEPPVHQSRRITEDITRAANLILTSTREQASDVVTLDVSALRKTFTLKGFARMLAALEAEAMPMSSLGDILGQRGLLTPVHQQEDDIPDPYRAEEQVGDDAFAQVLAASMAIAGALAALRVAA